jgi:hypothetical protein
MVRLIRLEINVGFRACLKQFVDIIEDIHIRGEYACFRNMLSGGQVASYLLDEAEITTANFREANAMNLEDQPQQEF